MERLVSEPEQAPGAGAVRRHKRFSIDVRVRVLVTETTTLFGRASDMSEAGLAVFLPATLVPGAQVSVGVTLPYTSEKMVLPAVVRNVSGFRYGLEFQGLSERDRAALLKACRALALVQQ